MTANWSSFVPKIDKEIFNFVLTVLCSIAVAIASRSRPFLCTSWNTQHGAAPAGRARLRRIGLRPTGFSHLDVPASRAFRADNLSRLAHCLLRFTISPGSSLLIVSRRPVARRLAAGSVLDDARRPAHRSGAVHIILRVALAGPAARHRGRAPIKQNSAASPELGKVADTCGTHGDGVQPCHRVDPSAEWRSGRAAAAAKPMGLMDSPMTGHRVV